MKRFDLKNHIKINGIVVKSHHKDNLKKIIGIANINPKKLILG